jgi:hypothetical protein
MAIKQKTKKRIERLDGRLTKGDKTSQGKRAKDKI